MACLDKRLVANAAYGWVDRWSQKIAQDLLRAVETLNDNVHRVPHGCGRGLIFVIPLRRLAKFDVEVSGELSGRDEMPRAEAGRGALDFLDREHGSLYRLKLQG